MGKLSDITNPYSVFVFVARSKRSFGGMQGVKVMSVLSLAILPQ